MLQGNMAGGMQGQMPPLDGAFQQPYANRLGGNNYY